MRKIKLLVTDLDDTLWEGNLLTDGVKGVKLYEDRRETLRELDSWGILLSAASNGNRELGLEALKYFGMDDLFLVPQIDFNHKSVNLETIAKNFPFGLDSFAFVDNDAAERSYIASQHPEVLVLDAEDFLKIPSMDRFERGTTAENRNRKDFYRSQIKEASGDPVFAASPLIETQVKVHKATVWDLERVHELLETTHRLNFSGNRHSKEDVYELITSEGGEVYLASASNRLVDYGRIGVCVVDRSEEVAWYAQDLLFSCRILGKGVEPAFLSHLFSLAREDGAKYFRVKYKPTAENGDLLHLIGALDIVYERESGESRIYTFSTHQPTPPTPNIRTIHIKRLGDAPEFSEFKAGLPEGLEEKIKAMDGLPWMPERWDQIRNFVDAIKEQASEERHWNNFGEVLNYLYMEWDNLRFSHSDERTIKRHKYPFSFDKEEAKGLVKLGRWSLSSYFVAWNNLPRETLVDGRVIEAFQYGNVDHLSRQIFGTDVHVKGFVSTSRALQDPRVLSGAIKIGSPPYADKVHGSWDFVDAASMDLSNDFLLEDRVVDAISNSEFPRGMVYFAQHLGSASQVLEFTADGFSAVSGLFPYSILESTLPVYAYTFIGGCGGGIHRYRFFDGVEKDSSEFTLAIFPGKEEFSGLKDQFYLSGYMHGAVGFVNFVEDEDSIIVTRNKTNYEAPNKAPGNFYTRLNLGERLAARGITDLALSEELDKKFDRSPEILWWMVHEHARESGKEFVGLFPSEYWINVSEETQPRRQRNADNLNTIDKDGNEYRMKDWQEVHDITEARVLSQAKADRHYDDLARQTPGVERVAYIHKGEEVQIWKVPVMKQTPLSGLLQQRTVEQLLFE